MEEQWYADRCRLRELLRAHPDWTQRRLAEQLGRSLGWVKKWRRRLWEAAADDDAVLRGSSRAPEHPPPAIGPAVVARILAIRDDPPAHFQRVPGPRAILYYLQQDAELAASGARLPRCMRTVGQILTRHGRIAHPLPRVHEPLERPPPRSVWQLDCKDVSSVPAGPDGKRQHVVEALNTVDTGTSILLDAQVRADFTAETPREAVVRTLQANGLPDTITIDRDPRFVDTATRRDFPSPVVRFLLCLGVEVRSARRSARTRTSTASPTTGRTTASACGSTGQSRGRRRRRSPPPSCGTTTRNAPTRRSAAATGRRASSSPVLASRVLRH